MKKIILTTLFALTLTSSSYAYVLEAGAVKDIVSSIKASKYKYKEHGRIFGYDTIDSCIYVSGDIAILKNYCYPAKTYPAKSFTIISKKYGMIDLYEEDLGANTLKHDVRISTFPDVLKDYFSGDLNGETIASVNVNLEKLYVLRAPACWSTNYSFEEGKPDVGCYAGGADIGNILGLQEWSDETQSLTADTKAWDEMLQAIDAAITK